MDESERQAEERPIPATDHAPEERPESTPSPAAEQGESTAEAQAPSPTPGSSDPPADGSPSDAAPSEPGPSEPAPSEPGPSEPAPSEPGPSEPGPSEPAPSEPAAAAAAATGDDEMTMEDVLAASDEQLARKPVHRGMITTGEVIMLAQDGIIVDVGAKIEGLLPYNQLFEFETDATEAAKYFQPGDEIQVYVVRSDIPNNAIILSKKRADQERAWNLLQEIFEAEKPVEVEIVEKVKGGLVANLGIRAFLPASQVDVRRVNDLDPFVGQRMRVRIIELNRRRNRVIISRRAILEEEIKEQKAETLQKLEPGARLDGEIVEITDFGAFVNLGGVDGLVHRSELTHGRFNHPRDVVKVGDAVKVEILDMDLERERINLSMKTLVRNPWEDVLTRYTIGEKVAGKVTNLTQFGAFVEIEPGLEGLIHVSEMSWTKRIRHPKEMLTEGDEVEAMVLKIDTNAQRISLGLRQTQPDPWSSLPDRYPPGTELTGPITGITDFGVFMEIEEGIEGLVHISELAHEHIETITDHFNRGDEITAVILNIDPVEQRASLSRKRLLPYTAEAAAADAAAAGGPRAGGAAGGRKGRRGGRRSSEIDYDYSYAESGDSGRTTTKLGDVYADLFAQFGLAEGSDDESAPAGGDAPEATADAGDAPAPEAPASEPATEPAASEADAGEAPTEPVEATDTTSSEAASSEAASSEAASSEAASSEEAPEADAPEATPDPDPENAIDADEAAQLLTQAFREGKRPAGETDAETPEPETADADTAADAPAGDVPADGEDDGEDAPKA
ncbi:MAG: 30S ribosomal protein S1 [Trueperaceae bacterium]|nr:30S ribosomal protein S1 [Trueperaceae bacterium]